MPSSGFPVLSVTCLKTAEILSTEDAFRGHNTLIGTDLHVVHGSCCLYRKNSCLIILFVPDFWTTKCTRCPDALDKLDEMASDPKFSHIRFVSICCDKLDGAREIIERDDEPRWKHVSHYFMDSFDKERAKKMLGFKSVPFYVMLKENGEITQTGSTKTFNFNEIIPRGSDKENENVMTKSEKVLDTLVTTIDKEPTADRVLILDEDF